MRPKSDRLCFAGPRSAARVASLSFKGQCDSSTGCERGGNERNAVLGGFEADREGDAGWCRRPDSGSITVLSRPPPGLFWTSAETRSELCGPSPSGRAQSRRIWESRTPKSIGNLEAVPSRRSMPRLTIRPGCGVPVRPPCRPGHLSPATRPVRLGETPASVSPAPPPRSRSAGRICVRTIG